MSSGKMFMVFKGKTLNFSIFAFQSHSIRIKVILCCVTSFSNDEAKGKKKNDFIWVD
jgi:hypothetical protein